MGVASARQQQGQRSGWPGSELSSHMAVTRLPGESRESARHRGHMLAYTGVTSHHTHTHRHALTHPHERTASLYLYLSLTHTHTHRHALTHTHERTASLSLYLYLSLTHTHTHIHTHTHTLFMSQPCPRL